MQRATAEAHTVTTTEEPDPAVVIQSLSTEEGPVQLAGTGAWSSARQQQGAGNADTVTPAAGVSAAATAQQADSHSSTTDNLDAAVVPQAITQGLQSLHSLDLQDLQPRVHTTSLSAPTYKPPAGGAPPVASQQAAPMFLQQPRSSLQDPCWGLMPASSGAFQLDPPGEMTVGSSAAAAGMVLPCCATTVGAVGLLEPAACGINEADGAATGFRSNNAPASRLGRVTIAQSAAAAGTSSSAAGVGQHQPMTVDRGAGPAGPRPHTSAACVTPVWGMTGTVGSKGWSSSSSTRASPGLSGTHNAHSAAPRAAQPTRNIAVVQPQGTQTHTASRHVEGHCGTGGTAAFKCVSRSGAGRAGRFSSGAASGDLPGPGQFRPQHTAVDKHVWGVNFAAASKHQAAPSGGCVATPGQVGDQEHLLEVNRSPPQDTSGSRGMAPQQDGSLSTPLKAARRMSACTSGRSPRSESAAAPGPQRQQQGPGPGPGGTSRQVQQGTSAFKATSRDQQAARTAPRTCEAATCDTTRQLMNHHKGPTAVDDSAGSTTAKAPEFSKQVSRSRQSLAPPEALGPGTYFRSGPLPSSWTGKTLSAGHEPGAAAPDFARTSSRPDILSSRTPSRCCSARPGGTLLDYVRQCQGRPATANEPGLWMQGNTTSTITNLVQVSTHTQAAVPGFPARDHHQQPQGASLHSAGLGGVGGSVCGNSTRPSSAALDYARCQRGTLLVSPAALQSDAWMTDHESSHHTPDTTSCLPSQQQQQQSLALPQQQQQQSLASPQQQQQQQQQLRPGSVGHRGAAPWQVKARPWSASPVLGAVATWGSRRPHTGCVHGHVARQQRSARPCGGAGQPAPHLPGRVGTEAGHHEPGAGCQRSTKPDFASQVKGGKFSVCSRNAVAAAGAGSCCGELLYEPRAAAQGHMRRAPQWSLPPNRVENSKKWARLAAQAALQ